MTKPPLPSGRVSLPPEPAATLQSDLAGRVDVDESAVAQAQPLPLEAESVLTTGLEQETRNGPRWMLWGGLLITLLVMAELVLGLWAQWQQSIVWGGLWSLAGVLVSIGALRALFSELRSLRQLKSSHQARRRADALIAEALPGDEARAFCQQLAKEAGWVQTAGYRQWLDSQQGFASASEQTQLFSQLVVAEADALARKKILRWSSENAVWVAISPFAAFDVLFVLWRNLNMIEQIARCYGVRLGYWSRIRLLRQVFRHLVYLGAAELVSDIGLEWLGAELSARLSARVAQGMGAGLLTIRLGMAAMAQCRPLPFTAEEKPRLVHFRRPLLDAVMRRLVGRKGSGSVAEEMATPNEVDPVLSRHQ